MSMNRQILLVAVVIAATLGLGLATIGFSQQQAQAQEKRMIIVCPPQSPVGSGGSYSLSPPCGPGLLPSPSPR